MYPKQTKINHFFLSVLFIVTGIFIFAPAANSQENSSLVYADQWKAESSSSLPCSCEPGLFTPEQTPPVKTAPLEQAKSEVKGVSAVSNQPEPKIDAPKPKSPASAAIGKPGRILADTKVVNGQRVCAKKNDKPKRSDHNPKGQIDAECCLDPDEIPNSNCHYPASKYGKLIDKYLGKK
jgi:hypothetical protein